VAVGKRPKGESGRWQKPQSVKFCVESTLSKLKQLVAICLLAFAFLNAGHAVAPVDLTGRIILPNRSGRATMLVTWATLKSNFVSSVSMRSPILPLRAQADDRGHFTIGALDPRWVYFGYALAPGCELKDVYPIDPTAGPLNVSLQAVATNMPPNEFIHGRVVDSAGHPVAGALIEIRGSTRNGQGTWPEQDVDPYAVSDESGNFIITGKTPFDAVDGAVTADGFAESDFEQWPSDAVNQEWARTGSMPKGLFGYAKPLHQIALVEGTSLEGRLLKAGEPVTNAEIRLNSCAVGSSCWFWGPATLTDDRGRFRFPHLPADKTYSVCGAWDLLASGVAVPQTDVHLGENGSTNNIGDINVEPVCAVAGKILSGDGKPLAAKSFYQLQDAAMGSSLSSPFGKDGSFRFPVVAGDHVSIFSRTPGYELTPMDMFLKSGSVTNITVAGDTTNLVIKMEPAIAGLFQRASRANTQIERRLSASQFDARLGTNAVFYLHLFQMHFAFGEPSKSNIDEIISLLKSDAKGQPAGR
jgi:hypothetical protein